MQNTSRAKATVRARVGAVKIHGPNSPDVLEGRVPRGHRETLPSEGEKLVEIDYDMAVSMFGIETADEMFAGVSEEERNG